MKKIFFLLVILVCTKCLQAQHSGFVMSYPIGFPMGNLKDYTTNTSFRGISLEFNRRQKPNLDIGIETGWNVFYQKENQKTYTDGSQSISGVQYHYTNTVPILAGVKYYKMNSSSAQPYVGLGLGTLYVDRSTDFGLYRFTTDAWQFCVRPEIGVLIHPKHDPGIAALIGLKYYAAFNTNDLDGQSYLTINVGIVFFTH